MLKGRVFSIYLTSRARTNYSKFGGGKKIFFKYRSSEFIFVQFSGTSYVSEDGELIQASQHTAKVNVIDVEMS